MSDLSVFANDYEWVIAESLEDALKIVKETTGYEYEAEEIEECGELPDETTVRIWWEDDQIAEIGNGKLIEKTCAEWIEQEGRGYLCASEM